MIDIKFYRCYTCIYGRSYRGNLMQLMEANKSVNFVVTLVCAVLISGIVLTEIILSMTPPVARDALIHHLAIPKLWLQNGGFYETPWAVYSYYPMNVDLLYLIPLYFKNDIIPNFISMAFGIATALVIFFYLQRTSGRPAAFFGALVFLSTPIVIRMSTVAYVDLGLTFFITVSLFAYIRWRNCRYQSNSWLFISATAMGIACGTKYNALIAWFFLTVALIFVYSRDTRAQKKALLYGVIFFMISLAFFSPWLIKNFVLTGNPFYPLFQGLLGTGSSSGLSALSGNDSALSIFKTREILYGENFWETLLVPIRYFFAGEDHSDRFFDGVLNPILIAFIPFAFMSKTQHRHCFLFLIFSVFFILLAFFLGQLRIRYILPVLPALTVLTVTGLVNILNWTKERTNSFRLAILTAVFFLIVFLVGKNVFYAKNYFQSVQPTKYIAGRESRDDFIQRHVKSYAAMKYINTNTSPQARIRLILLAGRGYYLERAFEEDSSFGIDIIRKMIEHSRNENKFQSYLLSLNCSHLLINMKLFKEFLQNNYQPEEADTLLRRMNEALEIVYEAEGYAVYWLIMNKYL